MCLYIEFQLFRLRNDQDIHCPKNASLCVHYNCVNYTYPFIALLSMLFNKPLRLLRNRTFSTKSQELAIIGEYQLPEWAADIPSHAQVAKFSLIIVGWWRLRISDGKFVKHTTEMILWSMILTFTLKKTQSPQCYFQTQLLKLKTFLMGCCTNNKAKFILKLVETDDIILILRFVLWV